MRRFLYLTVALLAMTLLGGCTSNNGDIGSWFGTWHLEKITIDGEKDTAYSGNIFWQFQNNVFCMLETGEYHTSVFHWATWSEKGRTLILDYDHPRKPEGEDYHKYYPPAQVHMPAGIIDLDIEKMNGQNLTVRYDGAQNTYHYYLKKQ